MGLALSATGFEKTLSIGYGGFAGFRLCLARAYSEKHGKMYEEMLRKMYVTDDFLKEWDKDCDKDLDILLWHSDCGGKLTPSECTRIKNSLLKLNIEDEDYKEFFNDFIELLKHCSKRRVIVNFY